MTAAYPTWCTRIFAIAAVALAASSCQVSPGMGTLGGWDRDISNRGEEWAGYRAEAVYELERDVFLIDMAGRTNGPALVPGMESEVPPGTFRGPTGVRNYLESPRSWRGVTGVIPAGTRIRVHTLRAKGNLRDASVRTVYAEARVMDGEFRGVEVDLEPVSLYRADPEGGAATLEGPNPDFLREAR